MTAGEGVHGGEDCERYPEGQNIGGHAALYWVVHSPVPHLPSELVYVHTVIACMHAFAWHAIFCEFGSVGCVPV